jgi:hypothetical protein
VSGDGYVASPGAYIGAHDVGQVQIYEIGPGSWSGDRWSRRNDFSDRPSPFRRGTIVAVGALTGSSGAGYVRVFRQNGQFGTKSDKLSKDGS